MASSGSHVLAHSFGGQKSRLGSAGSSDRFLTKLNHSVAQVTRSCGAQGLPPIFCGYYRIQCLPAIRWGSLLLAGCGSGAALYSVAAVPCHVAPKGSSQHGCLLSFRPVETLLPDFFLCDQRKLYALKRITRVSHAHPR